MVYISGWKMVLVTSTSPSVSHDVSVIEKGVVTRAGVWEYHV